MDTWFINALIMSGAIGGVLFTNKIIVEKKYNEAMAAIFFYFFVCVILSGLFFLNSSFQDITYGALGFGSAWAVTDYVIFRTRLVGLRHLPASMYFISARIISSLLLLILGITYFGDIISNKEYIGFFIGFIVFGLLFENQRMQQGNYKKGLIFLVINSLLLVLVHFIMKEVTEVGGNIYAILFVFGITNFSISVISQYNKIDFSVKKIGQIIGINIIQAILLVTYFVFLLKTYNMGDLGISYKILSYSMFIPIIGSIIFFKEKITIKKSIAFVLTIISLWFFMG